MPKHRCTALALLTLLAALPAAGAPGNSTPASTQPVETATAHRNGRMNMVVRSFGGQFNGRIDGPDVDCFSGSQLKADDFPIGSNAYFLVQSALCVVRVTDRDTALSATRSPAHYASEFTAVHQPMSYKSTVSSDPARRDGAVSEYDVNLTVADSLPTGDFW